MSTYTDRTMIQMMLDSDECAKFSDSQRRSFEGQHRVVDDTPFGFSRSAVLIEDQLSYTSCIVEPGVIEADEWGRKWWRFPTVAEKIALLVEEDL